MNKIFTVAIIGVGARGADAYGWLIHEAKDKFNIVSLCDLRQERLERFSKEFEVPTNACFTDENEFFKEKRADILLIATPDDHHVKHCLKGFALGYDIMMEKPITDNEEECKAVLAAQKKAGKKALVCHVLRYAPAFLKMAELVDNGEIGQLVAINALERVGFSHQTHSYVRGNWRTTKTAAPMILAKCCHGLDLLQFYAKSRCKSISSVGDLVYFKEENAPEGSAARCMDCQYADTCASSAKLHYLNYWEALGKPEDRWPFNIISNAPVTKEKLVKAVTEGPYGRCVFRCDNDVVDHQFTQMTFENGVKASLLMTAYTALGGRRIHFHGTKGELVLDEMENTIRLHKYGQDAEIIPLSDLNEKGYAHGGGDAGLVNKLYDVMSGEATAATSLESSVESHLMGICAEKSRLQGGELVYVHETL